MDVFEFIKNCNFNEDSIIVEMEHPSGALYNNSKVYEFTYNAYRWFSLYPGLSEPITLDQFCKNNKISRINFMWMSAYSSMFSNDIVRTTEYVCVFLNSYDENYLNELIKLLPGEWIIRIKSKDSVLFENKTFRDSLINHSGAWTDMNMNEHAFDEDLAYSILNIMKDSGIKTCVDFGCGPGKYVDYLNSNGIKTVGYDGNPNTPELTDNRCSVLNLAEDFNIEKFDCVLSLEVGEHIPEKYETTFINNLVKHANDMIILSWAIPGQGGYGHVNCQTNEHIRNIMIENGFEPRPYIDNIIRSTAKMTWFKNTFMIFKKNKA